MHTGALGVDVGSRIIFYENRDMAIAMSSSRADPVLGFNIPSSCSSWGYLNI